MTLKQIFFLIFLLLFNKDLFSMDIKPNLTWYEKLVLYPILVPYYAGKDFLEYVTVSRTITPLHKAATGIRNEKKILSLLQQGANIDAQDHSGDTPLVYALRSQRFELAKLLLEKGASVNLKNEIGGTAMGYIGPLRDIDTLKLMILRGGNIHEQNYITEDTLLHLICHSGNTQILEYLLSKGASSDINKINYKKETPIFSCIRGYSKEKVNSIKLLVRNGADLKIKNRDGKTPLALAESLRAASREKTAEFNEMIRVLRN